MVNKWKSIFLCGKYVYIYWYFFLIMLNLVIFFVLKRVCGLLIYGFCIVIFYDKLLNLLLVKCCF